MSDAETRARIAALAIPPAWRKVWIASSPEAHIQATGRDARSRKQYRYHPGWAEARRIENYDRLADFAAALPAVRAFVDAGLRHRQPDRDCVLALVLRLLDGGMIRVGNEEYAKQNGSRGLTTLRKSNVRINGDALEFRFVGKGGLAQRLSIHDARAARALRRCHELPGHHLLDYVDEAGAVCPVTSSDVNALLERLTGRKFTAKDFRTWAGTVTAFDELRGWEPSVGERANKIIVNDAVRAAAKRLGNTVAVCRRHYIHPLVVAAFERGDLARLPRSARGRKRLSPAEIALAAFLRKNRSRARRAERAPPRAAAERRGVRGHRRPALSVPDTVGA